MEHEMGKGTFENIFKELAAEYLPTFINFMRINVTFQVPVDVIGMITSVAP